MNVTNSSAILRPNNMIHSIIELSKHLLLLLVEMTTYSCRIHILQPRNSMRGDSKKKYQCNPYERDESEGDGQFSFHIYLFGSCFGTHTKLRRQRNNQVKCWNFYSNEMRFRVVEWWNCMPSCNERKMRKITIQIGRRSTCYAPIKMFGHVTVTVQATLLSTHYHLTNGPSGMNIVFFFTVNFT